MAGSAQKALRDKQKIKKGETQQVKQNKPGAKCSKAKKQYLFFEPNSNKS